MSFWFEKAPFGSIQQDLIDKSGFSFLSPNELRLKLPSPPTVQKENSKLRWSLNPPLLFWETLSMRVQGEVFCLKEQKTRGLNSGSLTNSLTNKLSCFYFRLARKIFKTNEWRAAFWIQNFTSACII